VGFDHGRNRPFSSLFIYGTTRGGSLDLATRMLASIN